MTCPPDFHRSSDSSDDCQCGSDELSERIKEANKFSSICARHKNLREYGKIKGGKKCHEHKKHGNKCKCKAHKKTLGYLKNNWNNAGGSYNGQGEYNLAADQLALEQQGENYNFPQIGGQEYVDVEGEELSSEEEEEEERDDSDISSGSSSSSSSSEEDEECETDGREGCSADSSHTAFQKAINKFQSSLESGYFNTRTCAKVGIKIREFLPKSLLKELEEQYVQTKCNFLSAFSAYPIDIAPFINHYSPSQLTFDVVMIGGNAGTLTALKTFADAGKNVLLIEKGKYPPLKAISLYNRPSLLLTDYVRKVKATAPYCDFPKTVVRPQVLGGVTTLNFNQWEVGSRKYYDVWEQISAKWSWEKVSPYYELIENYAELEAAKNSKRYPGSGGTVETVTETTREENYSEQSSYSDKLLYQEQSTGADGTERSISLQKERKGYLSINKSIKETTITKQVYSAFSEIGLAQSDLKITSLQTDEGFAVVPVISEGKNNILFAQKTLQLVEGRENIKIAMNTEAIKIEFDDEGRAVGVTVRTEDGIVRTIGVLEEVILGSSAISPVKLLTQSGVGNREVLERLGIPVKRELPNLGKRLRVSPSFFGLCVSFPQGALVDEEEDDDDQAGLAYLYGQQKITAGTVLNFYKALLKIDSDSSNVRVSFQVFSKSNSNKLRDYVRGFFHFEESVEEFIYQLSTTRDLLFMIPQLRYPESEGSVRVNVETSTAESVDTIIDTGMLKETADMQIMKKSIVRLKEIVQTKTFTDLNGELVKLPVSGCADDDEECYIRYFTVPGLLISGGMVMGRDVDDSVVDENLIVHRLKNVRCFSSAVCPFTLGGESAACPAMIGLYGAQMVAQAYDYKIPTPATTDAIEEDDKSQSSCAC